MRLINIAKVIRIITSTLGSNIIFFLIPARVIDLLTHGEFIVGMLIAGGLLLIAYIANLALINF